MRFVGFVLLPFLVQLAFVLGVIALTNGKGSFVGLGAMALGVWVLPPTALINWAGTRRRRPQGDGPLVLRTMVVTALFPALIVAMYLVPN